MKLLSDLLVGVRTCDQVGGLAQTINSIQVDSRRVREGDLFVAVPGTQVDGHQFIDTALGLGATAIVCEQMPAERRPGIAYLQVPNARSALGTLAHAYHGHPSRKLRVVGVTGTNGKTTTATLLYRLHRCLGYSCGLLSTIRNCIDEEIVPATHTTGDALQIAGLMARMVEVGCTHCFMEVTSHAIHQDRIAGLDFDGAIFTNLTHDHLDYHGSIEAYRDVKKSFFDELPSASFALTNADDPAGIYMLQDTTARKATYGMHSNANFPFQVLEFGLGGLQLQICERSLKTSLVGLFNAYNLTAVVGASLLLDSNPDKVFAAVESLDPVEGRMQKLSGPGGITVIVDFAHTPDALEQVLLELKRTRDRGLVVTTVLGCGGNRDRAKRPLMASIAARLSSKVIFTSDNPRNENPDTIIKEMLSGVDVGDSRFQVVIDRKQAIDLACSRAKAGEVILIAGKGHEKYQEIGGVRHPFDDLAVANAALERL